MPELPEIESLKQTLKPYIQGETLHRARVLTRNLRFPIPKNFTRQVKNRKVIKLNRRGKYLLIELEGEQILLVHLGMSGSLVFYPKHNPKKHDHVLFQFSKGMLVFNDPRRFGLIDVFPKAKLPEHPRLNKLGAEPLDPNWKAKDLAEKLQHRSSPIKTILFDQKLIAGLGNIYICEALFDARIHPQKSANRLNPDQYQKLHRAIKNQLRRAIKAGGTTIKDYLNAKGKKGTFQHQFRVYARKGEKCPHPQCSARIAQIVQAQRSTFYCPKCQK